jgi:hypothetical protein
VDINFKNLGGGFYLVRTQAGLVQAIKEYRGDEYDSNHTVFGYPKTYPSVITIDTKYNRGDHAIVVQSIHVNNLLKAIKDA